MGDYQYKCPLETTLGAYPQSCVMTCPTSFELRTVNGAQRCVSTLNTNVYAHLVPQPAVRRAASDNSSFEIDDLDHSSEDYVRYFAEKQRFARDIARATTLVTNQTAADANDQYATEIQAATDKYISEYHFLQNQATQQQSTLDLITSVKDNMFTVKDDMEYSVSTFDKQISDIRNQININKRTRQQATDYGTWIGVGLNFAIVLALLFLLFVFGQKILGMKSILPSSSGQLGAPARPAASEHTIDLLKGLTGLLSASSTPAK